MKYEENMGGWQKSVRDVGLDIRFNIEDNRLEGLRGWENMGLPTYPVHTFDLHQVYSYVDEFKNMFSKYGGSVVLRAIPQSKDKQRYTLINKTLEEVVVTLKGHGLGNSDYIVTVNEYDPAKYCGVIMSDNDGLIIEMVEEPNLENLCHGKVIPCGADFKKGFYGFGRMNFYNVKDDEERIILWETVKRISSVSQEGNIPNFEPMKGYFEFVYSNRDGALRFIDYKKTF